MDIAPAARGHARLWRHIETGLAIMAVWTERIPGRGEDADPLVLFHRPTGRGLVSVFDGVDRTHAWVAARRVRALAEEWFAGHTERTGLGEHIAGRLVAPARNGRIRGSIHRAFPTTLAALDFRCTDTGVAWDVLWAGDSRCYVAEPEPGLQQLTRDDTDLADALEQLVQDPPMTNMVSAGRAFALNRWQGEAALPCLLVCATDGFFGYVDTPAQFEHVLWETLQSAQDITHWTVLLAERVGSYTGDDASLAVVALGFDDFDDLRVHFRRRAERIRTEHAEPMRRIQPQDRAALAAARTHSWSRYRPDYERRLPPAVRGT
jgi:serine/threonine protein phosphatase PrpC